MADTNLFSNLDTLFFDYKDAFSDRNEFNLKTFRKNMVTKVYCEKTTFGKPLTFLFSVSYFNSARMHEVVIAGLKYMKKKTTSTENVDVEFVEKIHDFLEMNTNFSVELVENSIFLCDRKITLGHSQQRMELFNIEGDESAKHMLVRSLCIFLASCEKTITNNLDEVRLNDYGQIS